jgi:hypothetical protein
MSPGGSPTSLKPPPTRANANFAAMLNNSKLREATERRGAGDADGAAKASATAAATSLFLNLFTEVCVCLLSLLASFLVALPRPLSPSIGLHLFFDLLLSRLFALLM